MGFGVLCCECFEDYFGYAFRRAAGLLGFVAGGGEFFEGFAVERGLLGGEVFADLVDQRLLALIGSCLDEAGLDEDHFDPPWRELLAQRVVQ